MENPRNRQRLAESGTFINSIPLGNLDNAGIGNGNIIVHNNDDETGRHSWWLFHKDKLDRVLERPQISGECVPSL
jgi:hypothetical protein